MCEPGVACGLSFQHHFATLAFKKMGDVFQGLAGAFTDGARRRSLVLAYQCDMAEIGRHREITSLKSFHAR